MRNISTRNRLVIGLIIGLLIIWSFSICGVCYRSYILEKDNTELHNTIEQTEAQLHKAEDTNEFLRKQLTETENSLADAKNELKKFVTPIEYRVASATTYDLPISEELQQYTYDTCLLYGIEHCYDIVLAVMWQESNYDATVISVTNDYGLMQINKSNHKYLMDNLGVSDMLDPYDNIESGVYILSTLLYKYNDIDKALMAYNMGSGGAAKQWSRGNYSSVYSRAVLSKAELIRLDKYSEK